jgi:ferredoxin
MEIDVRRHVWLGEAVHDSHCLTCGECVERCPRGLLRFQPIGPVTALVKGLEGGEQAGGERDHEAVGRSDRGGEGAGGARDSAGAAR